MAFEKGNSLMSAKLAAVAAALVALGMTVAFGQTPRQVLEGGIYLQSHYGDDDRAIRLYRGVAGGADRAVAGLAQMQLVSALLHKRDFSAASEEFRDLVTTYADQEELMASVSKRLSGLRDAEPAPEPLPTLTRGTLETVYHLRSFGAEVTLPPGWSVVRDQGTDGVSDNMFLRDEKTNFSAVMYLAPFRPPDKAADVDATLRSLMDSKVKERRSEGMPDYRVPPETVKTWLVQNRHALSAVAEASGRSGQAKAHEYLAYVCGTKSYVLVLGSPPGTQIPAYRDRVERLIVGTMVP